MFVSENEGVTWTAWNAGLMDLTVFDVAFTATRMVATTNTSGVFNFPLGTICLKEPLPTPLVVYPNPSNVFFTIQSGSMSKGSQFKILDTHGRDVYFLAHWPLDQLKSP